MHNQFENTTETPAAGSDTLIAAGEHAAIELSEDALDSVTGGIVVGSRGSGGFGKTILL
jgi:hypothetical protein